MKDDMMTDRHSIRAMALYNRWMNDRLYALCADLDDDARKADRGAFFGSIHATLDHILLGDRVWMGRFTGRSYQVVPIGTELYADFDALRVARAEMDTDILAFAEGLTSDWLAGDLTWTSGLDGISRTRPCWLLVTHLFNHQTHHRGQVTTLLSQLGIDPGPTDLPWMEGFDTAEV
ncbi:DinB family protein [Stappia indica]|uniref:DinB family protein n=1 Tax=Stappia indica TaxID=538381 RepID=UPI001CD2FD50|nr:DinB family protein [Stappia indica]MCA1299955.1 DinB family protein [Stappia indica]